MIEHFRHFFASAKHSKQGIIATFKHEKAFQQEVIICIILLPVVYVLSVSFLEKMLLLTSLFLVLVVELLNTGIESTIDRIGAEHHELSGRAKDQGSAAVMFTIIIAILIWLGVLL